MEPYIGEIRVFSFNKIPKGWAVCNGAPMTIKDNQALFALLGTMYGGDGKTTFNLPDLRGRAMMNWGRSSVSGTNYQLGNAGAGGSETVTLTISQIPSHTHIYQMLNVPASTGLNPMNTSTLLAQPMIPNTAAPPALYPINAFVNSDTTEDPTMMPLHPDTLASAGGDQPHENRMPFLTLQVCIAITGYFPSRN